MPPTLANGKVCYIELPAVDDPAGNIIGLYQDPGRPTASEK
jgi:hypothetical protein